MLNIQSLQPSGFAGTSGLGEGLLKPDSLHPVAQPASCTLIHERQLRQPNLRAQIHIHRYIHIYRQGHTSAHSPPQMQG